MVSICASPNSCSTPKHPLILWILACSTSSQVDGPHLLLIHQLPPLSFSVALPSRCGGGMHAFGCIGNHLYPPQWTESFNNPTLIINCYYLGKKIYIRAIQKKIPLQRIAGCLAQRNRRMRKISIKNSLQNSRMRRFRRDFCAKQPAILLSVLYL